jgi:glutamyl-tRNA(Gln) amidotransferase subunit E
MNPPFKPFHLMTPEDYAAIGLKCGLEIHQQLLTKRKLFCRCPAGHYSNDYDAVILRHMRPTLSELGEYDGTALMEKKTRKNIFYRIHQDTVCTYDMDDTPPFFIDDEALDISLEVALLLHLNMVSELHIARKQYLDGSIPTGFQRTTIVGVDGWIPFRGRKIRIVQLGLEEDACREVSDNGHDRIYLTDRLGMPLIEPVTYPDMTTPEETAAVAQLLRRLTRSTGKVRTGYGAGRQDVNVSVAGGTRIEIKGVPRISAIPLLIYNEAMRQCSLLAIRDTLKGRGVTPDTFEATDCDVTHALSRTTHAPIRASIDRGHRVRCTVLKNFAGLLKKTTQTDTVFAREFSDRARVIACLTSLPNIVHSDAASEFLTAGEWQKVRRKSKADPQDALILVWGDRKDLECACREFTIRAREATEGVPSDTRQALKDGTNGFERVLPGADRMYPDTDLPPLAIGDKRLARIREGLPEHVWDREERYQSMGLATETVERLSISPRAGLFDRTQSELETNATLAALTLTERLTAFRRAGLDVKALDDDVVFDVFKTHAEGRLAREGIVKVLRHLFEKGGTVEETLAALGIEPITDDREIAQRVEAAVDAAGAKSFAGDGAWHRHVMGCLMKDLLGRVAGRRLAEDIDNAKGRKGQS